MDYLSSTKTAHSMKIPPQISWPMVSTKNQTSGQKEEGGREKI